MFGVVHGFSLAAVITANLKVCTTLRTLHRRGKRHSESAACVFDAIVKAYGAHSAHAPSAGGSRRKQHAGDAQNSSCRLSFANRADITCVGVIQAPFGMNAWL